MDKKDKNDIMKLLNKAEIGIFAGIKRPIVGQRYDGTVKFLIENEGDYVKLPFAIASIIETYAALMGVKPEDVIELTGQLVRNSDSDIEDKGLS